VSVYKRFQWTSHFSCSNEGFSQGDPGFFKGGGGGGSWYLGIVESMGHAPKMLKFENWNPIENCYNKNTSNATK